MQTILVLAFLFQAQTGEVSKPHPLAPSLPQLSKEEEARAERVIKLFILFDIGKLPPSQGPIILRDFHALGPEHIFLLIDHLNQTANLEDSCPVVVIGRKVAKILSNTQDLDLLSYAQETIGSGVTANRYKSVIRDLQFGVRMKRNAVQAKAGPSGKTGGGKAYASMSLGELAKAAEKEQGPRLHQVLTEASKRQSLMSLELLAIASQNPSSDTKDLAQSLLKQNIQRKSDAELKKLREHDRAEVRTAAAAVLGQRGRGAELIELLQDPAEEVQKAAHRALVTLSKGVDHGPTTFNNPTELAASVELWRGWWTKHSKR